MANNIKIVENQSVLDAVTQHFGTLEEVFVFCLENGLSITDDLQSNDVLTLPAAINTQTEASNYFAEKNIKLATGFPLVEASAYGIGAMIIEDTFIVS